MQPRRTDLHLRYEREIAEILGLPDDIRQGPLIPTSRAGVAEEHPDLAVSTLPGIGQDPARRGPEISARSGTHRLDDRHI
jgi:hypothetical protein